MVLARRGCGNSEDATSFVLTFFPSTALRSPRAWLRCSHENAHRRGSQEGLLKLWLYIRLSQGFVNYWFPGPT